MGHRECEAARVVLVAEEAADDAAEMAADDPAGKAAETTAD